jgi:serine/threonine protein kinase
MRVVEFRETPEPLIVMDYYTLGNIVDAGIINEDMCVTVLGQLLDGLNHLHQNGVAHRDLKPENILVTREPYIKFVIGDFGLAKVATETALLRTFCGTLKYMAPEVFPGLHDSYGPLIDICSLGVIVFESIYSVPKLPTLPKLKKNEETVRDEKWMAWIDTWSQLLLNKLEDEEEGQLVEILCGMIEVCPKKRWGADRCLRQGFQSTLFKRRASDGLVVCTNDEASASAATEVGEGERRREQHYKAPELKMVVSLSPFGTKSRTGEV